MIRKQVMLVTTQATEQQPHRSVPAGNADGRPRVTLGTMSAGGIAVPRTACTYVRYIVHPARKAL